MDFENYLIAFLADIFIYLLIVSMLFFSFKNVRRQHLGRTLSAVILLILFCVYPYYDTDYFHYKEIVESVIKGYNTHLEDVYLYIINFVNGSYSLFRLLVWGSAVLLAVYTSKRAKIKISLFILILVGVFITKFAYTRAFLSMALSFAAVPLIFNSKKTDIFSMFVGFVFLLGSFYFHKTGFFSILIITISFLFLKMNKKILITYFISYPILFVFLGVLLSKIMSFSYDDSLIDVNRAQGYLDSESAYGTGIGPLTVHLVHRSVYYLVAILYVLLVVKGFYSRMPRHIKVFANSSFFIITISTLFLFITSYNANALYYRFLYFSIIPSAVLLSYCISNKIYYKYSKYLVIYGILGTLYVFTYGFYASFSNPNLN